MTSGYTKGLSGAVGIRGEVQKDSFLFPQECLLIKE